MPFLEMGNNEEWEKFFPDVKISNFDKQRIYNDFKNTDPKISFSDYLKGFKDINPNYDWNKYIDVFLPHIIKNGSFPQSLLFTKEMYPIPHSWNSKPAPISNEIKIQASQTESFLAKFKNIFPSTTITFTSAKTPIDGYWNQIGIVGHSN